MDTPKTIIDFKEFLAHYDQGAADGIEEVLSGTADWEGLWNEFTTKYGPWPPAETRKEDLQRGDFADFLQHYDPKELSVLDTILAANKDWAGLWEEYIDEYGPWPPLDNKKIGAEEIRPLEAVVGKAVIIGVDYVGANTSAVPSTSVNAAKQLRNCLVAERFKGGIRMLVDDGNIDTIPSKENILDSIQWLATGSQPGHSVFFAFIGKTAHGGHKETEGSGCLYPADHRTNGSIRGADVLQTLSEKLHNGSEAFILCDARPLGYNIAVLRNQLVSFLEGDAQPRVGAKFTNLPPNPRITILSVHKPRLNLETSEYNLTGAFISALKRLRVPCTDHESLRSGRMRFFEAIRTRFGGEVEHALEKLSSTVLQKWCEDPLVNIQGTLRSLDVDPKKSGLIQNMAKEYFTGVALPPFDHMAPPTLAQVVHEVKDIMQSSSIAPMLTSNAGFGEKLGTPFMLHPVGWQTFGVFPEHKKKRNPNAVRLQSDWTPRIGYISSGGDILGSPRELTLEQALDLAIRSPECKGFCFKSNTPEPNFDEVLLVYFKDKFDLSGRGWVTFAPRGAVEGDVWQPTVEEGDVASVVAEVLWKTRQQPTADPLQRAEQNQVYKQQRREKIISKPTRQRLVNFYQHYNPAKLPSVVATLLEYTDTEETLFAALHRKYGPEPPQRELDKNLPTGWVLAESPQGDLFYKNPHTGQKQWERPKQQQPERGKEKEDKGKGRAGEKYIDVAAL
eukprot:TRINITY_DN19650_c0_g1_i1.p1 TRINITY_DN19650_c0_g1~~TRINITY_DN19650_c0_g1_i1.p1  ORF type:complete len:738 (+),score=121.67 TRINITY_DN19650_c0_g1_i1:24-2216(+)